MPLAHKIEMIFLQRDSESPSRSSRSTNPISLIPHVCLGLLRTTPFTTDSSPVLMPFTKIYDESQLRSYSKMNNVPHSLSVINQRGPHFPWGGHGFIAMKLSKTPYIPLTSSCRHCIAGKAETTSIYLTISVRPVHTLTDACAISLQSRDLRPNPYGAIRPKLQPWPI